MVDGEALIGGDVILIGAGLYVEQKLGVGELVRLVIPEKGERSFRIGGVFDLGNGIANDSWILMELDTAQKFLGYENGISRMEIQIDEVFEAKVVGERLNTRFENVKVYNWIDSNESLLSALQSQTYSSVLIQVFVLLAITLGISSVLAVSVVQKSKQLGILKAMGARSAQASRIFLLQGSILGLLGASIGIFLGIGLIYMFQWGTAQATGQPLFSLTVEYVPVLTIGGIALASSTLAALLPAKRSSKLNPIEVIRNG